LLAVECFDRLRRAPVQACASRGANVGLDDLAHDVVSELVHLPGVDQEPRLADRLQPGQDVLLGPCRYRDEERWLRDSADHRRRGEKRSSRLG